MPDKKRTPIPSAVLTFWLLVVITAIFLVTGQFLAAVPCVIGALTIVFFEERRMSKENKDGV